MKNKLTSISLITVTIIFLLASVAWAQIGNSQVKTFKELFKIPSAAVLKQKSSADSYGLEWTLEANGLYGSGDIGIDPKTGEILRYREYYPSRQPRVMKPEECQEAVENLVSQLWPNKKGKLRLQNKPVRLPVGSGTFGDDIVYAFSFQRFEGQIPVEYDRAEISFDASTWRVLDVHLQWSNVKFPVPANVLLPTKATTVFTDKVPIELQWKKFPSGQGDLKFNLIPIYTVANGYSIDAVTGELIKPSFFFDSLSYSFGNIDTPPSYPVFDPSKLADQSVMEKTARSLLGIPDEYELKAKENHWLWGEQGRGTALTFSSTEKKREFKVAFDRITGNISQVYFNEPEYVGNVKLNYESGKANANSICKSLAPDEYSSLRLSGNRWIGEAPSQETHYTYVRYIYGIPYLENGANVVLNERTGNLLRYYIQWERNLNIPRLTSVLGIPQIRSILAQNRTMQLTYRVTNASGGQESNAKLVYVPKVNILANYDAVKGTVVSDIQPKLIGNQAHWAAPDFQFLTQKGIVDASRPIDLDRKITRAEFIKLLVLADYLPPESVSTSPFNDIDSDSEYAAYVARAYTQGIVRGSGGKLLPDKILSRQEAAVLINIALKSEGRINPEIDKWVDYKFKDESQIAQWATKAVHDVAKLGYMIGYNDYYNPTRSITWGEAVSLMKKYMSKD